MPPEELDYLVPGRTCGACTACCTHLLIAEAGFEKMSGVSCVHRRDARGCAIYATRPDTCRGYHCLWRSLDNVDESWRPDRSGILMQLSEAPEGDAGAFAVDLILIGPTASIETTAFAGLVAGFVESGTLIYLNVPPGPGLFAPRLALNARLAPAIAARDLAGVKALLRACLREAQAAPVRPIDLAAVSRELRDA